MKIEIEKEDFVRLAVYASCADLPKEENKCGMTLRKVMDSFDKDVAAEIADEMLALRTRIEILNGTSVEELAKTLLEVMMGDDEEELDLDENDGDVLRRIMKEDDE
ncbi:hypothetical protein PND19_01065 [Ligilactobacillus ruminis]|uniref:hypothetical protein n=1 Tax=Ligilactobacillus ruminis TaxID=1623 RepID=UPI00232C61EE|nr:hypothetical protein [Ligilactobacillus ruminis]MDB7641227.1 hypothetical protein [Ligilactobacillus ruminis]MDB7646141.1 hypothetical protein [Ligilactobacillus ruminis]